LGAEPQPLEANRGTLRRFLQFLPKKYTFLSILWSKFLLKTTKSVLMRPQGMRPGARIPTCSPCYATAPRIGKRNVNKNKLELGSSVNVVSLIVSIYLIYSAVILKLFIA